jgi:hypothetical protein
MVLARRQRGRVDVAVPSGHYALIDKDRILELWRERHGPLSPERETEFLARDEVKALTGFTDQAVAHGIGRERQLAAILKVVLETNWWFAGERCKPDGLEWCSRCKPHNYPTTVYMTTGGSAFHKSRSCVALMEGQQKVADRGWQPAEVNPVNIQEALGSGRFACLVCIW